MNWLQPVLFRSQTNNAASPSQRFQPPSSIIVLRSPALPPPPPRPDPGVLQQPGAAPPLPDGCRRPGGGEGLFQDSHSNDGFFFFCFQELSKTQMSISGDVFIAAALLFPVLRICGRAAAVNVPQLLPGTLLPCSAASGATSAPLSAGYQFFIRTKVKAEQRKRPPWTAVTNSQPAEGPSEAPPLTGTNGELVCSDLLRSASWKVQRRSRGDGFISSHLRFNTHPHFLFGVPAKRSEGQTGGGAAGRTDGRLLHWPVYPQLSAPPADEK